MIKSGMASPYLYGVDALRFICALMVTVFHLGFASWASPGLLRNYRMSEIENFAQPGWVGVELFFIISGLVIVNSAASADAGSFVRGRALRLYPAMWICASVVLVFIAMKDGVHPGIFVKYLSSMMLFPFGPWLDGQFWTLGCEIGFYALVFGMIATRWKSQMLSLAHVLAVASSIFIALLYVFPESAILDQFRSSGARAIPFYYGIYFATGIYVWAWSKGRMTLTAWLGLLCAMVAAVAQIHMAGERVSDRTFAAVGHSFSTMPAILIWAAGTAIIFFSVRYAAQIERLPKPILISLKRLGAMTYPLYLIHFAPGIQFMDWLTDWGLVPLHALVIVVTGLCLSSFAICKWGEPPIRSALRVMLERIPSHPLARPLPRLRP